jgi:hypothetical protein
MSSEAAYFPNALASTPEALGLGRIVGLTFHRNFSIKGKMKLSDTNAKSGLIFSTTKSAENVTISRHRVILRIMVSINWESSVPLRVDQARNRRSLSQESRE